MGFRISVVVCVVGFLLGSLFTHWIADSLTLWKSPVTDEQLWTAVSYYRILANSPPAILWGMSAITAVGGGALLLSIRDGEAGNLMFDGASIFLFLATLYTYLTTVIPTVFYTLPGLPEHVLTDVFPQHLREPLSGLASANLMCSVALTGVLALQAARHWAEIHDVDTAVVSEDESKPSSRAKTPNPS
ncbi:hypothetical protein CYLTODRAFT_392737 [Cylindrobasidium torrendii FP15055 ss-10]|uniref:Shr3 amino acid permease chaperone n=1 Tax=Cylindrobasidium torrendii FP15055 ss-10 TaxID=1314674 RepID=A0A0D7BK48_9AGAR|nr:hypothetical protein CYLTODRAFT_392737 [Cylindrobasidium torrendii FP15055 ss-10]